VLHMAHLNMKSLSLGARLTVLGLPLGEDDKLVIEYRNYDRTSAVVASCASDSLVITVGGARWRLLRIGLKPDDEPASLSRTDDRAFTIWEFLREEISSR
jgi:hypothetical protein